jgi:hypothetical protein
MPYFVRRSITGLVLITLLVLSYYRVVHPVMMSRMAYSQDWTLKILFDYMEMNNLHFPKGWDDLRGSHDLVSRELHGIAALDEIRQVVDINFEFDPRTANLDLPIEVIRPRSGASYHWVNEDPNSLLRLWLREHLQDKVHQGDID